LRAVYTLIAAPEAEGGVGVSPGLRGWDYVESVFPLRDSEFNRVAFPSHVSSLKRRNGFKAGPTSGSSTIPTLHTFAITTARKSPCILRLPSSTVYLLFLFRSWEYFPTFSYQVMIGSTALYWAFGLFSSNMRGSVNSEILLYNGESKGSPGSSNNRGQRT